jgi:polyisoprenoid-binding protein YceI
MTFKLVTVSLMASAWLAASPAIAADYVIDTKGQHASITFRIKHLGFSWLTGRFDKFSGTISYDEKNPAMSSVKVEIDPASVSTNHAERDKHLRADDFFDVAKFPSASFVSKSVTAAGDGKATVVGDLTLHGVTKEVSIDASLVGGGKDPWGGERIGFTGTTKLALADFAIKKDLGPAAKEVELTLDVEAVKK